MTFSREPLTPTLAQEILPLLRAHYQEIAHFKDIPLDPDWKLYESAHDSGMLHVYTARKAGLLLGYAVFFVRPNPHYKTSRQAVQDILYLDPSLRSGFNGLRFIRWCDRQLRHDGVQAVYHHVKCANDFGPVLRRMGYQQVDMIFAKRLDEWEDE